MKVRFAVSVGLGAPDPPQLADVAEEAERGGFDTLWMSDLPSVVATEPALGMAFVAACTRRMHLGANFIPFGMQPYVLAHRLAQLDRLTGGRLLVTLVPGLDLVAERAAVGTAGRHRGRMMDEVVPALRQWWAGEAPAHSHQRLPVLPVQQPLEIWLGGSGPQSVTRAGRFADGWLGSLVSPRRAAEIRHAIEEEAARAGRRFDPEHFGLAIGYARAPQDLDRAARLPVRRPRHIEDVNLGDLVPVGATALRQLIGQLVDVGLSKFVLRPIAPAESTSAWSDELAWLSDSVMDLQT